MLLLEHNPSIGAHGMSTRPATGRPRAAMSNGRSSGTNNGARAGGEGLASPSRTLEKGLQVLSLFDVDRPEWTFKEIREAAGLPKATGFRLVKTLENLKYLGHD